MAAVGTAVCLVSGGIARDASALDVPLRIRETAGVPRSAEIVTSGVPIPRGELLDEQQAAMGGVDAQFRSLAEWSDGSVKWLQVSFPATVSAYGTAIYQLTSGAGDAPSGVLSAVDDGQTVTVNTGPLRFTLKRNGFNLFDEAWIDLNQDGSFAESERLVSPGSSTGSRVVGTDGENYTSANGVPATLEVEEAGPLRVVIRFEGVHSGTAGDHLDYSGRIYAYRGREEVHVRFAEINRTPTDTYSNGGQPKCRWLAGEGPVGGSSGSLQMEDLSLVTRLSLSGSPSFALQGDPAGGIASGDLLSDAWLYQDSSGGQYWQVSGGTTFSGYEIRHGQTLLESGSRAQGFADIHDGTRGLSVAIRHFWENFPDKIMVSPDGTVTVGLFPGDFSLPFEHRPGERKSHWVQYHFHAGDEVAGGVAASALAFQEPLRAMAPASWYCDSQALDDLEPYDPVAFPEYEAHNGYGADGYLSIREQSDFYGWQDFGDVWSDFEGGGAPPNTNNAANNLEYDSGFAFIQQALRTTGLNDDLSDKWWKLAAEGNEHTADVDIYHVHTGPLPWMWGGMWNHTGHGKSGFDDPHRGDNPNAAHSWNRGMLAWYYLTGDRDVLEGALEVGENITWRVENGPGMPGASGTEDEERGPGHALQILTDMYLLTWDSRYYQAAHKLIAESHADTKEFVQSPGSGTWRCKPWMIAILMRNLGRFIEAMAIEQGTVEQEAIDSLLGYAEFMEARAWVDRDAGSPGFFHYQVEGDGTNIPGGNNVNMWTLRASDAFTFAGRHEPDPVVAQRYRDIARVGFEDASAYPWCFTCPTHEFLQAKVHQVVAGSGQEYMRQASSQGPSDTIPPGAITDLAAVSGPGEGEISLAWTATGDDGVEGQAISYLVRRSAGPLLTAEDWSDATPVPGAPIPGQAGSAESMILTGLGGGEVWHVGIRAVDDALQVGDLSNSPSAPAGADMTAPTISDLSAQEEVPGTLIFRWSTDEPATSAIEWDPAWPGSGDLANVVSDGLLTTFHELQVSGLNAGTTVHYRSTSADASGNADTTDVSQITVAATDAVPPAISGLGASVDGTGENLVVVWNTDEPADGRVEYGADSSCTSSTVLDPSLTLAHAAVVAGVAPGETVYFRVLSADGSGNVSVSAVQAFTITQDEEPPQISTPEYTFTLSQARMDFLTTEPSWGEIRWGVGSPAGNTLPLGSAVAPSLSHSVILGGLMDGLTYLFEIELSDLSGNISLLGGSFALPGGPGVDTTPPGIPLGLEITAFTEEDGVALRWAPNSEADLFGYHVYRRVHQPGSNQGWSILNAEVTGDTAWGDEGLVAGTSYEYAITARDSGSNESGRSPGVVFDPGDWLDLRTLGQSRPNPFTPQAGTSITFQVPAGAGPDPQRTVLAVFDLNGRRVRTLFAEDAAAGDENTVRWDGCDGEGNALASGVYFSRLRIGQDIHSRKMVLLR